MLEDYYFFNMGDHGGVLVAVKYFKTRGETRDIWYSIDEGQTWETYTFSEHMLRVYGLMTEPGENTTVFTMFGSGSGMHKWLIIKVDLRKVFERDCNEDDFKLWSPPVSNRRSNPKCILGKKEIYQRRAPNSKCYTGLDKDRPVRTEICPCDIDDYICDYGFVRKNLQEPSERYLACERNKTLDYDPYKVPSNCRAGRFYNRTKGYIKKISDVCAGGRARFYEHDAVCFLIENFFSSRDTHYRVILDPMSCWGSSGILASRTERAHLANKSQGLEAGRNASHWFEKRHRHRVRYPQQLPLLG